MTDPTPQNHDAGPIYIRAIGEPFLSFLTAPTGRIVATYWATHARREKHGTGLTYVEREAIETREREAMASMHYDDDARLDWLLDQCTETLTLTTLQAYTRPWFAHSKPDGKAA